MMMLSTADMTMTSLEIAELVQSRHDSVKRTIERLAVADVITLPPMVEKPTAGRPSSFYVFSGEVGKRDSIVVVAQLCPQFTAKLVDRWAELEAQIAKPQPQTLSRMDLIKLAYEAEQENIALRGQVAVLEPKAQALDTIADTSHTYTLRESAKTMGVRESDLIRLLLGKHWIYRDSNQRLQPYADKVEKGIFINRLSPVITAKDGQERVFTQMRITAYGLTRITGLVNKTLKVA